MRTAETVLCHWSLVPRSLLLRDPRDDRRHRDDDDDAVVDGDDEIEEEEVEDDAGKLIS